ncbi:MAG TPA: hemolysin family protein [Candidatus Saccharimonadales bacterium]|nr:hemolysin family protein [Candidatus Saccharimonadales bacterium]
MIEIFLLAIAVLLILACGIFVAAEFALIAVNRSTVERLAAKGDGRAQGVAHALATLSTQLSSAQVGITITNLAIGFLAEPVIAHLLGPPLTSIGVPRELLPGIAVTVGLVLATALTMIFGELVPKNIAIAKPLATAKFIQGPLLLFTKSMTFPIKILNGSANFALRRLGVEPQEELASARSADELLSLVRRSAEKGTLAKETARMLERSLNFGDLTALDVMTPRIRVRSIQADQVVSEVLKLAKVSGLSRFPVYGKNLDDVLGVVHIKQALGVPRQKRDKTPVRQIMRPPVLVPSSIQLEPLLEDLRKGGLQMAVVVDEFGAVDGVVTIEDLLEELVGEVKDEHDRSSVAIRKRTSGAWLLSGLLRPDEIGEKLNIYLPEEEDVETIAGLVTDHLERIPKVGDRVVLDGVDRDGDKLRVELQVERMDGLRIDRLQMKKLAHEKDRERQP